MPRRRNDQRPIEALLTVSDIVKVYGVRGDTVREWIRKGIMGHRIVGPFHSVRVPAQEAARHFRTVAGVKL